MQFFKGSFPFPCSVITKYWLYSPCCTIHPWTHLTCNSLYFPLPPLGASLVAQMVKNPSAMWETWVRSLGWEDPLEECMATQSSILAWRVPMDRGVWHATTVHGVTKSQIWLSDYQSMMPFLTALICFIFSLKFSVSHLAFNLGLPLTFSFCWGWELKCLMSFL